MADRMHKDMGDRNGWMTNSPMVGSP